MSLPRISLLLLVLLVLLPHTLSAQKQNNVWYFGIQAGLDFNGPSPQPIFDGKTNTHEGSASIADRRTGALLFYTTGDSVWNRQHRVMWNGSDLMGHYSSTQSAVILPDPGDSLRYYIFTSDAVDRTSDGTTLGVNYSVVDMRFDDGNGMIVPGKKNLALLRNSTEKLTAIRHCNGVDYWVIAHGWGDNSFHVWQVTRLGVSPPTISRVGAIHTSSRFDAAGYMKGSPDGHRLALANFGSGLVQIFTFDNKTGIVSRPITIARESIYREPYGVSFSPNSSKLYVAYTASPAIFQYDVALHDSASIGRSKVRVTPDGIGGAWALQLGPDRRLYCSNKIGDRRLAVIQSPDLPGLASGYKEDGIDMGGSTPHAGLPNLVDGELFPAPDAPSAANACIGESVTLVASGGIAYRWSGDGITCPTCPSTTFVPPRSGLYTVTITTADNCETIKQVQVTVNPKPAISVARVDSICPGDSITLVPSGAATYRWSPSSGLGCVDCERPTARPDTTTTYTVIGTSAAGCVDSARITVAVRPRPSFDLGDDDTICIDGSTKLSAPVADAYLWSPAAGLSCTTCADPIASPKQTTTYRLTISRSGSCPAVDSIRVVVIAAEPGVEALGDTTICAGDTATLEARGGVAYRWSPSLGLDCDTCASPRATPATTTTYRAIITTARGCSSVDSATVTIGTAATVDARGGTTICPGDSARLDATGATSYTWSPATGLSCTTCAAPIARPDTTTTYVVIGTVSGRCSAWDTVTVFVNNTSQISAGENDTICAGGSIRLRADGGTDYRWSGPGLSCTDCADPIATPAATTTYYVSGIGAGGCRTVDSVTVVIDDAQTVRVHIDRTHHVGMGDSTLVPIILDDAIRRGSPDTVIISLGYASSMLRVGRLKLEGTLLDGWIAETLVDSGGRYSVRLISPDGRSPRDTGVLANVELLGYMSATTSSELDLDLGFGDERCLTILPQPGRITLDSICGLSYRLIEFGAAKYSLDGAAPNPVAGRATISFSIGLDAHTRLEILDAAGREVTTLVDGYLLPGEYTATWDATGASSGVYYYRLTSGDWGAVGRMVVAR